MVSFSLIVRSPGPFHDRLALYVDDDGLKEIPVSVRGDAVPPSENEQSNAKPQ